MSQYRTAIGGLSPTPTPEMFSSYDFNTTLVSCYESVITFKAFYKRRIEASKHIFMYKYVFRAVGCFPGPYLANSFNISAHKLKQYSSGGTSSYTGMAAVVIAIAHVL